MEGSWTRLIVAGVLLGLGVLTILGVEGCQRFNAASDAPPAGREVIPTPLSSDGEKSAHEWAEMFRERPWVSDEPEKFDGEEQVGDRKGQVPERG